MILKQENNEDINISNEYKEIIQTTGYQSFDAHEEDIESITSNFIVPFPQTYNVIDTPLKFINIHRPIGIVFINTPLSSSHEGSNGLASQFAGTC